MNSEEEAIVVIPARRDSTRLPKKLALAESGKPLLAHTVEQCLQASLPSRVVVAVDCEELAAIAETAGAQAVFTQPTHLSGSDRVAEAMEHFPRVKTVINVQGDEPEIEPDAIDAIAQTILNGAEVATLAAPLPEGSLEDPAAVKLETDNQGNALQFVRRVNTQANWQLHIGIYGYSVHALKTFTSSSPTQAEKDLHLEQLRFLENGVPIRVVSWPRAFLGIDTRSDYDAFLTRYIGTSPP